MFDGAGAAVSGDAGQVPLGLDAAWGFAQLDQTSPARAGAVRALVDVGLLDQPVTELRIHGVSGSNGPAMLEHPTALQVGGDKVAGFFRRWSPGGFGRASVPWKLEAYSWGGLTEAPLASASWLLLAPFMMYNLAHFMLPPGRAGAGKQPGRVTKGRAGAGRRPGRVTEGSTPGPGHRIAQALVRLLALAATVQLAAGTATVMISTVGWQAGRASLLPSWLGWYAGLTTGWRLAIALAGVAGVVAGLWWISVTTASRYEARTTTSQPEPGGDWPLTRPGFWHGEPLVRRQRSLHVAAACAAAALIVALPAERLAAARLAAITMAAVVLAAAAGVLISPLADWQRLGTRGRACAGRAARRERDLAGWTCRAVLAASAAAVGLSGVVVAASDRRLGPRSGPLPGLTGFTLGLAATQLALLGAFALIVARLAIRARSPVRTARTAPDGNAGLDAATMQDKTAFRPYLGGFLSPLFAMLAFCLGSLLTAVVNLGVARLLGTPVPGGFRFSSQPSAALAVPWPVYAAGAGAFGLVAGLVLAVIVVAGRYLRLRWLIGTDRADAISITDAYLSRGGGEVGRRGRRQVASAWALGQLADVIATPVLFLVGGWMAAIVAAEIIAGRLAGSTARPHILAGSGWLHGTFSLIAAAGAVAAVAFTWLLRSAYGNVSDRRTIGALWDVATFWPRAAHPLAPPCYAERAVPEVVDRIRLITGREQLGTDDPVHMVRQAEQPDLLVSPGLTVPAGPVLLTGYSQGTIIAIAVVAQLPRQVRDEVALLTLACPARRLYGRAFPAYFGPGQLTQLSRMLDAGGRWRNVVRRSDYIGSWIFCDPLDSLADRDHDKKRWLDEHVDQPCWDPVVLVPDSDPTPPPVHRHSAWWQDPRSGQVGDLLVGRLMDGHANVLG